MDRQTARQPARQTGSQCQPTLGEQEEREGLAFPRTGGRDVPLLPPGTHFAVSFRPFFSPRATILLSAHDLVILWSPPAAVLQQSPLFSQFYLFLRRRMSSSKGLALPGVGRIGQAGKSQPGSY